MKTTLFALECFDWRSIAASHPAWCVCQSCAAVRAERDAARLYGALASEQNASFEDKQGER